MKQLRAPSAQRAPLPEAQTAEIRWLREDEGGRKNVPAVKTYRAVLRVPGHEDVNKCAWDLVVTFIKRPTRTSLNSLAVVSFASKDAPRSVLREGTKFELTEGPKTVAKGVVLSPAGGSH